MGGTGMGNTLWGFALAGRATFSQSLILCWWVGLCSLPISCLAWGHLVLEYTGSMAGPISSVQSLSRVRLFATLWTTACWASLSITSSRSPLKLMSIESALLSNLMVTSTRTFVNSCLPGWLLPMARSPQQATVDPCLCGRPSNTHSQVWLSLLGDHCSFPCVMMGPRFCLCPTRVSVSPSPMRVL